VFFPKLFYDYLIIFNAAKKTKQITSDQGTLQKGKVQYSRPPSTNYFRFAAFDIANNIYFF
jgi:hypothetical protein